MCRTRRDESGTTLILALVFVIITGVVGVALVNLAGTNELATPGLQAKAGVEYAADGAVDAAIQSVRYSDSSFTTPTPTPCFPPAGPLTLNGTQVYVDCSQGSAPAPAGGRSIEFEACGSATCTTEVELTAQVTFVDQDTSGYPAPGSSLTIVSWDDQA